MTRLCAITAIRLTTAMPERLTAFYTAIGFVAGAPESIGADEMALLGLDGGGTRWPLTLGEQRLDLDCFDRAGAPYPTGSTACDLWFQHIAIVTGDAAAAWARAERAGATPISTAGAVTLPPSAGGVTAAKLRDPEGHPIEFLQVPPGAGKGASGIDHSAISVADADASRGYYAALGLVTGNTSLNQGPTQVALDGLAQVEVDVVPLEPATPTPHLELLGYRTPRGRIADRLEANDIAATRIVWAADTDALLRDPDGHLHLLRR